MSVQESPMLLLTNDDGYDAPGLLALRRACDGLGRCRVIAPLTAQSGCGHRVTTHEELAVSEHENGVLAVSGTPADCVRLAIDHLATDVSWVLSGVNAGGNLGTDVFHSGTVAAVREGVILGIPGVAVSHYIARGRSIDWERATRWTHDVLRDLLARPWRPGTFWNVNLPHPEPGAADPEVVFCPLDPSPLPIRYEVESGRALYRGDYQQRARREGGDVAVCFGGAIAVSLVRVFDVEPNGLAVGLSG
jgi:5'-nucleotidase